MRLMPMIALLPGLAGCAVVTTEPPRPVAWSNASPYAEQAPAVIAPVPGSYCAEAVAEAQSAAAEAAMIGGAQAAARADRTAGYAVRDCR